MRLLRCALWRLLLPSGGAKGAGTVQPLLGDRGERGWEMPVLFGNWLDPQLADGGEG
jgi:hypothetical protein